MVLSDVDTHVSGQTLLPRRHDVDGLRAIAVVAVLGYHFFPDAVPGGFIGVDVFFVISGFVITSLLVRGRYRSPRDFARFWGRRVRRLMPALALVMASTLIVGWFVLWPQVYEGTGANAGWAALSLGNFYSWSQVSYFAMEPIASPLLNLWSLGVEEQFYLVWPVAIAMLALARHRIGVAVLLALGVVSWGGGLVFVYFQASSLQSISSTFYLPWFRAWELIAGALVASFVMAPAAPRLQRFTARIAAPGYLVALALVLAAFFVEPLRIVPAVYACVPVLATATLIALGQHSTWGSRQVSRGPMLWVGRISYPLYLWHWPMLAVAMALGLASGVGGKVAVIVASFAAAWATWALVEKRIQSRPVSWRMMTSLVALMVLVAGAGFGVSSMQGFPHRLTGVAATLGGYSYDPGAGVRSGECFLESTDARDVELLRSCLVPEEGKANILLWGDSHAAHLYPGMAALLPTDATLSQLTVASCLPTEQPAKASSALCTEQNALAAQAVASRRFSDVVIAGHWHDGDEAALKTLLEGLDVPEGVTVTVAGPVPEWSPSLPRAWSLPEANRLSKVPKVSRQGLDEDRFGLSQRLGSEVVALGATFLDPLAELCSVDGCLVRVGENVESLTSYDYGHLTESGSRVVAKGFYDARASRQASEHGDVQVDGAQSVG